MLQVILKMDKHGNGLEIDQNNLGRCRALGNIFTEERFRHMCILSGCDYLPSLHGIGLGKACKLLRLAKEPDITKVSSASPFSDFLYNVEHFRATSWAGGVPVPSHRSEGAKGFKC